MDRLAPASIRGGRHQLRDARPRCAGDERDESAVALRALPNRFIYLYDFGDGWEHEVVVVGPGGDWPGVARERAHAPPRMSAGRMATPSSGG